MGKKKGDGTGSLFFSLLFFALFLFFSNLWSSSFSFAGRALFAFILAQLSLTAYLLP